MIINNGFKFTNIVGDCYLENNTLICKGDQIVRVYDFVTKNRVLLDALAINAKNNKDIVYFTQKYGPLVKWSLSVTPEDDNDESLFQIGKEYTIDEFEKKYYGRFDIKLFECHFMRLQELVNLISAYKQKKYANMLCSCLFLLSNTPAKKIEKYNRNATTDFSQNFELAISDLSPDYTLLEIVEPFIKRRTMYYDKSWELENSFFIDLISNTCTVCQDNSIPLEKIIGAKDVTTIAPLIENSPALISAIQLCSGIIISDEINFVVRDVKPYFRILSDGTFKGDWIIPDLLSALYMDIFLKNASSVLLKKCENPTCGEYFETTLENTAKKYCSTRCAQLMAKRKQREREKSKK